MKKFSSRPGKPARPLQTYSLKERLATFCLVVKTRKSGLCAARTGRGRKWPNHADFLTFGDFGDFCRPTGCQNFENSGRTPFAPRLFPRQSEAKRKRLVRLERARNLPSAEGGRVETPPPYFSYRFSANLPKFGKFSALARARREISQNFRRNRDQRPEFALDLGFGQKVVFRAFLTHPSHRL